LIKGIDRDCAEVNRASMALEKIVSDIDPPIELPMLGVAFLYWAARFAFAIHLSKEDFQSGAALAWDTAKGDFAEAISQQYKRGVS